MTNPPRIVVGSGKRPLRVAVVVNRFPTMSETFIFNKVAGLAEGGFQVTVITHDRSNDAALYRRRLKELSIRRHCLRGFSGLFKSVADFACLLFREPRRAWQWIALAVRGPRRGGASRAVLLGALTARTCDVVHFELSGLGVAYLPVFDLLRPAKIFVSCRGTAEHIKPLVDPGRGADLERLFRLADRVHCVSQDMLDSCKKYGLTEDKAFVNRPAIRADAFTRATPISRTLLPAGPIRICSIGRLHWIKGLEFALLAIKLLKDAGERVTWEIIGDGPEREKLLYMIHALGLSETVTLAGNLDSSQVKERLDKSDIFLLPSLSEGISNSALEAMAMELPVISTRSGGMDELITDGQNGLLVNCYAPDQIASSIRRLAGDLSLQHKLGRNGRQTILEHFSLERQITCFVSEYALAIS